MKKHIDRENIKELIIIILILLGGIAFTTMSFCVYYIVKPQNAFALAAICTVDFIYNLFCSCLFFKYMYIDKWLLKGILLAVIYIVAFIAVTSLFCLFSGALELLKNIIVTVVLLSFFTCPCILIIMTVLSLILIFYA